MTKLQATAACIALASLVLSCHDDPVHTRCDTVGRTGLQLKCGEPSGAGGTGAAVGGGPAQSFVEDTFDYACNQPTSLDDDACLTCLRRECCAELNRCKLPTRSNGLLHYECYWLNFSCTERCFESHFDEDGGTPSPGELALQCGSECVAGTSVDRLQPLLQCALGIGRATADAGDESDGGFDNGCTDVCRFPSWR